MKPYIIVDPPPDSFTGNALDLSAEPKVSFCIPTLNNESTLPACLRSIANQDYRNIEIIIVDGYSDDRTREIAQEYTDKIYSERGTLGSARQTSIEHATGSVLAIFDSDIVIPHPSWLTNALPYFNADEHISTVWPRCRAPDGGSMTARMYRNFTNLVVDDRIRKNRGYFGGGNALFLRKCFDDIGGINRSLHWGEDFDWAKRLKDRGYGVVCISDYLYHDTMRSFQGMFRKQFLGAETFTKEGFGLMNLSKADIVYENLVIGTKGMLKGILLDRDLSWLLVPPMILARAAAYGYTYLRTRG